MKPPCSVLGCDRESSSRGWCATHYSRWRRTGEVGSAEVAIKGLRRECSVDGCLRDATSRGMCGMHYLRILRKGTLEITPRSGPGHQRWSDRDSLTYDAAHDRVKRSRGPASSHACAQCEGPAEDWAYQHMADDPLIDDIGRPYSDDLDDYAPMCRACHRALDMQVSHRQQGGNHLTVVTVEEAALFAGVSVSTVRSWVMRGSLEPIRRKAKPMLFRYEDVSAAQRGNRSKAWEARHAEAVRRWESLQSAV